MGLDMPDNDIHEGGTKTKKRGTHAEGGGRPKRGSHIAAEGASPIAITSPVEYIPGKKFPPENEIPPYFPEPGTPQSSHRTRISRATGRDGSGKVIPHKRDQSIAGSIAKWVALGASENEIANYLNLRPGVLRREYGNEMTNGKFENDMAVGCNILDKAKTGDSERMMMFYAKARMGWREEDSKEQGNAALLNIHIHN